MGAPPIGRSSLRPYPSNDLLQALTSQLLYQSDQHVRLAVRLKAAPTLAPTKWPLQTKPPAPQAFLLWPLQKAAARHHKP